MSLQTRNKLDYNSAATLCCHSTGAGGTGIISDRNIIYASAWWSAGDDLERPFKISSKRAFQLSRRMNRKVGLI